MESNKLNCKACGNDAFASGQIGSFTSEGNIRPMGSIMATGSPLILTFCTKCGEASSIKVAKPEKFK
ncbi:hypothetical protein [Lysinibacillus sphaericus]|uniref:hypothetical protein n=1 Tax=Lysinibacillus sphaericus TaxID=1421 RepID=UPI000C181E66|nr:hypothetical protein [Lysinibacillus sphaericus]MBG9693641.1 hypothetical protein [Lysinibacillus sphaericus]PIJ99189.1 hypothetical protein CTN02_04805 [Lysinibacillus sphaericus]